MSTDSTAPTSTANAKNADQSAYTSGNWTNQNVTVSLNATDNTGGSGVKQLVYSASGAQTIATTTVLAASLPAQISITTEGTTTISYHAVDNAGNVESPDKTFTVKLDKAAPVISGADVNNTTWRNTDLSANFTASDNGSGLADQADASFTLTASAESQGANSPTTVSKTVTDVAGNSATRSLSALIDKHAPVIEDEGATSAPDGLNGWYKSDVTNRFSASDGLSGFVGQTDPYTFDKTSSSEATGAQGAKVSYASPTANDSVDGNVGVDCQPASGSVFGLGTTKVTCSATDKAATRPPPASM